DGGRSRVTAVGEARPAPTSRPGLRRPLPRDVDHQHGRRHPARSAAVAGGIADLLPVAHQHRHRRPVPAVGDLRPHRRGARRQARPAADDPHHPGLAGTGHGRARGTGVDGPRGDLAALRRGVPHHRRGDPRRPVDRRVRPHPGPRRGPGSCERAHRQRRDRHERLRGRTHRRSRLQPGAVAPVPHRRRQLPRVAPAPPVPATRAAERPPRPPPGAWAAEPPIRSPRGPRVAAPPPDPRPLHRRAGPLLLRRLSRPQPARRLRHDRAGRIRPHLRDRARSRSRRRSRRRAGRSSGRACRRYPSHPLRGRPRPRRDPGRDRHGHRSPARRRPLVPQRRRRRRAAPRCPQHAAAPHPEPPARAGQRDLQDLHPRDHHRRGPRRRGRRNCDERPRCPRDRRHHRGRRRRRHRAGAATRPEGRSGHRRL
ncbi:MAG: hypothetical protein AVDCRST_MAG20-816, partial [uncultured Acidimicrobiales bacterium]